MSNRSGNPKVEKKVSKEKIKLFFSVEQIQLLKVIENATIPFIPIDSGETFLALHKKFIYEILTNTNKWEILYGHSYEPGNEHDYIELCFSQEILLDSKVKSKSFTLYLPEQDLIKLSY